MIIDFIEKLRLRMEGNKSYIEDEGYIHPALMERLQQARRQIPANANEEALIEFSQNNDGFIREAALERLSSISNAATFQLLVLRLNDWVYAVRISSRQLVHQFIREENAQVIIDSLDELFRLFEQSRDNHVKTLQMVEALLALPSVQPLLLTQFACLKASTARYAFSFMLKWPEDALASALPVVVQHSDCRLRMMVLDVCKTDLSAHIGFVELLLQDPQPSVRQKALHVFFAGDNSVFDRNAVLKSALLDDSAGVRDVAHWYAKKGGFAISQLIDDELTKCNDERMPAPKLIGLMGLEKNTIYLDRLKAAATSPCVETRTTAYWALRQLPDIDHENLVLLMLEDPSQRIFRYGMKHRLKNHVALSLETTKQLIQTNINRQHHGRVVALCDLIPLWERLAFLLELVVNSGAVQDINLQNNLLARWIYAKRSCYLPIPKTLIASIDESLIAVQNTFPRIQKETLTEIVRICTEWRR